MLSISKWLGHIFVSVYPYSASKMYDTQESWNNLPGMPMAWMLLTDKDEPNQNRDKKMNQ